MIKVNLLNEGLQVTEVGLKREIALFSSKKKLKDLYQMVNILLIDTNCLEGFPKRVCWLDARKRLDNVLFNVVKHLGENS